MRPSKMFRLLRLKGEAGLEVKRQANGNNPAQALGEIATTSRPRNAHDGKPLARLSLLCPEFNQGLCAPVAPWNFPL